MLKLRMRMRMLVKKLFLTIEDPLNMYRTASNETALIYDIPNMINEENIIIAQRQKKFSILSDKFCEEQPFLFFLPKGKLGNKAPRNIPISPA